LPKVGDKISVAVDAVYSVVRAISPLDEKVRESVTETVQRPCPFEQLTIAQLVPECVRQSVDNIPDKIDVDRVKSRFVGNPCFPHSNIHNHT
jgi:hypothetical protein